MLGQEMRWKLTLQRNLSHVGWLRSFVYDVYIMISVPSSRTHLQSTANIGCKEKIFQLVLNLVGHVARTLARTDNLVTFMWCKGSAYSHHILFRT